MQQDPDAECITNGHLRISIHWSYLRGSRAHSVYCIGYI